MNKEVKAYIAVNGLGADCFVAQVLVVEDGERSVLRQTKEHSTQQAAYDDAKSLAEALELTLVDMRGKHWFPGQNL